MKLQQDISDQLNALVHEGFLAHTPIWQLKEYPRYIAAIEQRLEKYPRQKEKDGQWVDMLRTWWRRYEEKLALFHGQHKSSESLDDFRWMLEELRVSLFAQALGTRYPVSEKRLEKAWREIV
jgi:ATP-dependent helicase HrpA